MDEDFEKWHLVMRQRWTRMSEGRSKARGEERQGQGTRNEEMWTKEAERRKKEAGARQTAMGKRNEDKGKPQPQAGQDGTWRSK